MSGRACEQSLSRLRERRGGGGGEEEVAHENLKFSLLCLQACEGEQERVSKCHSFACLTGLELVATTKRCVCPTRQCVNNRLSGY